MSNINSFIKVSNKISKNLCDKIIQHYEKVGSWQNHSWNDQNGVLTDKLDDIKITYLDKNWLHNELEQCINSALKDYFLEVSPYSMITGCTQIRLNKYVEGACMEEHVDHIRKHQGDGIPVLSIVGLLNDDFQGGEFIINSEKLDFKQGDILIFPSSFIYPHSVLPVTKGIRYSFSSWGY